MSNETELFQARQRWQKAQATLATHKLKSDPELGLDLLKRAERFPAWRGPLALAGSWIFPQVPAFMGQSDDISRAVFGLLGGISLGVAVWFLVKDGLRWWQWMQARRALSRADYRASSLLKALGADETTDLVPLEPEGARWKELEQWVKREAQLQATWKRWEQAIAPIRHGDAKLLEEAVFAITALRDLKETRASKRL